VIHYDLEGHRRIVAERIERIADDYRRANARTTARPPERPASVLAAGRSAQWPQLES
jgi:hypothetical protein